MTSLEELLVEGSRAAVRIFMPYPPGAVLTLPSDSLSFVRHLSLRRAVSSYEDHGQFHSMASRPIGASCLTVQNIPDSACEDLRLLAHLRARGFPHMVLSSEHCQDSVSSHAIYPFRWSICNAILYVS